MGEILTMNRIDQVFKDKKDILNVYFTAGFPHLEDTVRIARSLEDAGADMLEIGMPFSDPIADGPTIQESSQQALDNGMSLEKLMDQLKELRNEVTIPVLLMGYINPVMQYGVDRFTTKCEEVGIDGLILPDLPMQEYLDDYAEGFQSKGIHNIFLISPNTSEERIREIDEKSGGFIYVVSSSSITGAKTGVQDGQLAYYQRIKSMELKTPQMIGFGISDNHTFQTACEYSGGAIIGSAFIKQLMEDAGDPAIKEFVKRIKG